MFKAGITALTISALIILTLGCSSGGIVAPDNPAEAPPVSGQIDSSRVLWGVWDISYDPAGQTINIEPMRNTHAHFNITGMVTPPACYDCVSLSVNSFDFDTRILDADVTLRNPTGISGYDVRGILYTNDLGHRLMNADSWTPLWDIAGGLDINPFRAFAKYIPNRVFAGLAVHTEKYLVYIPKPPAYGSIKYAVDASWPGNCKEPYAITNFWQEVIVDAPGSSGNVYVDVCDWADDVTAVTLFASEINGEPFAQFTKLSGDTWSIELVNEMNVSVGLYEVQIAAVSEDSVGLALWNVVTITISEVGAPFILNINPDHAHAGTSFSDVMITGYNFLGPDAGVKLKKTPQPEIVATDVVVLNANTITCDIDIPKSASPGHYDVEVTNDNAKVGTAPGLFEVLPKQFGWAQTCGAGMDDICWGVAINDAGNAYVIGEFCGVVDFDPGDGEEKHLSNGVNDTFLIKYDQVGTFQWARTWGGAKNDYGYAVALDVSGNVYATGLFSGTVDFDPGVETEERTAVGNGDVFLSKFSPDGGFQWVKTWGGGSDDASTGMKFDGIGNIYVAGKFSGVVDFDPGPGIDEHSSNGSVDMFISKFDSTGNLIWANTLGGSFSDICLGLAVDGPGDSYIAGYFAGTVDFDPGPGVDEHVANGEQNFLCQFDPSGVFQWARHWGKKGSNLDIGCDVALDEYGDAYVTGSYEGILDFDPGPGVDEHSSYGEDVFLSKFNSQGDFLWARTWGGYDFDTEFVNLGDRGTGVDVDEFGNVYVTGCYNDKTDFDPGPGTEYHLAEYKRDMYLSKFFPNGEFQWVRTWGGSDDGNPLTEKTDVAWDVTVCNANNPHVVGLFYHAVEFDPGPEYDVHVSNGEEDAFIIKFLPDGYW